MSSTRKNTKPNVKPANPRESRFKTIIVPTDFSKISIQALPCAREFAKEFGAHLVLLHVVEKAPFIAGLEANPLVLSEKEIVEKAKMELRHLARTELEGISVDTLVRTGKAFNEINQAASELNVDLIIISTHGYTGLKHTLLGSTAERVVRHAPCAVMVVRRS